MYKVTSFTDRFGYLFPNWRVQFLPDRCGFYSIWTFCLKERYNELSNFLSYEPLYHPHLFPYIYWSVLLISIYAVYYTLRELIRVVINRDASVSSWRSRKYFVLPYSFIRKARILGALSKLYSWFILIYGIVFAHPQKLDYWIALNIWLIVEVAVWIIDLILGSSRLDGSVLIKFGLPLINVIFVKTLRDIFLDLSLLNKRSYLGLWWIDMLK